MGNSIIADRTASKLSGQVGCALKARRERAGHDAGRLEEALRGRRIAALNELKLDPVGDRIDGAVKCTTGR